MKVLDLSAGNRAVWFDKLNPHAVFVDIRREVKPHVVADTKQLPFKDGIFDLVVFDPPHVNFGANADMSKTYGHTTTAEIRRLIEKSSEEAWRVSKRHALMSLKWNDHDQKLERILTLLTRWEPLVGQKTATRTARGNSTYWVLLKRVSS